MNLSAVIISWNSGKYLVRLLSSFGDLFDQIDNVVVVDNASKEFPQSLADRYPELKILRMNQNLGFAGAANYGISQTASPYILLLNPDIVIDKPALVSLYEKIVQKPKTAIVCGRLHSADGSPQTDFQIRNLPTIRSVISDALFLDETFGSIQSSPKSRPIETSHQGIEVEQPAAACWLLSREAWDAVGGFDEHFYPAWFEDVDFCKRVTDRGWKIKYYPQFQIEHKGEVSLETLEYQHFIRVFYKNLLFYWKKHHKHSYPLVWFPVKLGVLIRLLFFKKR